MNSVLLAISQCPLIIEEDPLRLDHIIISRMCDRDDDPGTNS